ncbi:hypothetical protein ASG17_13360 [Brevundimonas sp. Leaf363]|nr:hypothetical protein ASG17_13360 [Brevundimonas sp. Leaf363]
MGERLVGNTRGSEGQSLLASLFAAALAALRSPFQNVRLAQRRCFHHSLAGVRMPFFAVAITAVYD